MQKVWLWRPKINSDSQEEEMVRQLVAWDVRQGKDQMSLIRSRDAKVIDDLSENCLQKSGGGS